ncbi:apolipoprotein C-I-like [Dendropsophus ebraccatus]|uniref:apolipoprotein C-I-like n=1 Tax=Dendropsophus ebraccatus TaxID=150705 RepID=UPI003831B782
MKLLLALAVVIFTLSALAEPSSADSQKPSLKDRFTSIGESIKDAVTEVGDKFKEVHNSEFLTKARNLFKEWLENIKEKISK